MSIKKKSDKKKIMIPLLEITFFKKKLFKAGKCASAANSERNTAEIEGRRKG